MKVIAEKKEGRRHMRLVTGNGQDAIYILDIEGSPTSGGAGRVLEKDIDKIIAERGLIRV